MSKFNSSNKKNEKDFLIHEKKGIEAFIENLKQVTFNVLYVLLKKEEPESVYSLYYTTFADYCQMLNFPFNQGIGNAWNASSFMDWLFQVFNFFQLTNYVPITYFMFIFTLYLVCFSILIVIVDILYVSYKIVNKKLTVTWPLDILRLFAQFFFTVLFLPITDTLFQIQKCSADEKGDLILSNYDFSFEDVVCYQGFHIVHVVVCGVFNLIYMIFACIIAFTYFEPMMTSGDRKARQDSRGETLFLITKIIGIMVYAFFPQGDSNYYWWLVLAIILPSIPLWWAYNQDDPYYDPDVARFYQIITTYYLWTNINLLICQIFGESYTGGLIAWGVGLPFIVLIMLNSNRNRINTLIKNQIKFTSGEQIQAHIKQVLQLIQFYKTNVNAKILLIGYIEKHKEICQEEDCYLKIKRGKKKQKDAQNEMDETCQNLIKELNRVYLNGVKKFPTSTKLRISYAFFLMERMKKRDLAYVQFEMAEKTKPTFDEQFIIYRFKKMYEENQGQQNEDGDDDIIQLIQFDSALQLCEEYMKRAVIMHKEFWSELKEENPVLQKLNIIGSKISQTVFQVKEQMATMQRLRNDIPKLLKVLGQFFIYVLNERESGLELIKKSKELITVNQEKDQQGKENAYNYKDQPVAYLLVSNQNRNEIGQIQDLNSLFSILFGYQREELIGKQAEVIIPTLISQYHSQILVHFYENIQLGQLESQYIGEQQQRFGRNRNGYIFPITYKVIPLNEEYSKYVVEFQANQIKKDTAYIFTSVQGLIKDITPYCIFLFGLDSSTIKKGKTSIDTLVPDWQNFQSYNQRKGKEINANVKQFDGKVTQVSANCSIQQIIVTLDIPDEEDEDVMISRPELIGYQFRFEKVEKAERNQQSSRYRNSEFTNLHNQVTNQLIQDNSPHSVLAQSQEYVPKAMNLTQTLGNASPIDLSHIHYQNDMIDSIKEKVGQSLDVTNLALNQKTRSHEMDLNNSHNLLKINNISKLIVDLMKPAQYDDQDEDDDFIREDETFLDMTNRINYGVGIRTKRLWNNKLENLGDDESIVNIKNIKQLKQDIKLKTIRKQHKMKTIVYSQTKQEINMKMQKINIFLTKRTLCNQSK